MKARMKRKPAMSVPTSPATETGIITHQYQLVLNAKATMLTLKKVKLRNAGITNQFPVFTLEGSIASVARTPTARMTERMPNAVSSI